PQSDSTVTQKLVALSRRSDRRRLRQAYDESSGLRAVEGKSMRSKSDHAWRMAAQCAKLAQQADQKDEREFYVRMRDSWITVANRYAFLDIVDEHGTPSPLSPPRAGRYVPYPVSRTLERRRSPAPRR